MNVQPATPDLRTLSAEEWDPWFDLLERAFGGAPDSPARRALWHDVTELDRSIAAYDGKQVVGTAGAFSFRLAVPGPAERPLVPMAGVTMVSAAPTHRRRGILTAMMRRQLDDVRERGEALAGLTASEPPIYGRFGYGPATQGLALTVQNRRVRITSPLGTDLRPRYADPAEAAAACHALYTALGKRRPGWLERPEAWQPWPVFDDPAERDGFSSLQCVLVEDPDDGRLRGYARYAVKASWVDGSAESTVRVRDAEAADPAAHAALWRFLLDLDLSSTVVAPNLPVDTPLLRLVSDPRRCAPALRDGLYLRLVDVGAALAARSYARPVDVVLEVADDFCGWNAGRWRLSGDERGASCERTTDAPDLAVGVRELATAYLGGVSLTALAAAGGVTELRAGALRTASAAFLSDVAPWLPRGF